MVWTYFWSETRGKPDISFIFIVFEWPWESFTFKQQIEFISENLEKKFCFLACRYFSLSETPDDSKTNTFSGYSYDILRSMVKIIKMALFGRGKLIIHFSFDGLQLDTVDSFKCLS